MAKHWDCMAEYVAETTSWSTPGGTFGAVTDGKYMPPGNGRLIGLRVVINRQAATSLTDHVQFKLQSQSFKVNSLVVGGQGSGLQTAPALMSGDAAKNDWEVDQPVTTGTPINIEARCAMADTAVTNSVLLYGLFELAG